jgi:hypothetical protein
VQVKLEVAMIFRGLKRLKKRLSVRTILRAAAGFITGMLILLALAVVYLGSKGG